MNIPKKFEPRIKEIEAWQWSTEFGEEIGGSVSDLRELGKEIAQWCGGEFEQDNMPGQENKTYYWTIKVPYVGSAYNVVRPGEYVVRLPDGVFTRMSRNEFEDRWVELTD